MAMNLTGLGEEKLLEMQLSGWQSGRPYSIESLLEHWDSERTGNAVRQELLLDLVYQELCLREETQEMVFAEEYLERFPSSAQEISQLFTVHAAMKRDFDLDNLAREGGGSQEFSERYQNLREVGAGGLGHVMLAYDSQLDRNVAIKKLLPGYGRIQNHRERFLREATLTSKLQHPAIIPIYDAGLDDQGELFYTMKFVDGESLDDATHRRMASGFDWQASRTDLRRLVGRMLHVCRAISAAHQMGIVHRDIKPSNVLFGKNDETLVVDWGVAGYYRKPSAELAHVDTEIALDETQNGSMTGIDDSQVAGRHEERSRLTLAGMRLGTPAFMSPEQRRDSASATPLSDVYSIGATLHFALQGETADSATKSPKRTEVPFGLLAICKKAMRTEPEERYASADALAADLENWLADEPLVACRDPWWRRSARWCRRHRRLMGTALACGAAIVLFALVYLAQEIRIQENRYQQLVQKTLADQRFQRSEKIATALGNDLHSHALFRIMPLEESQVNLQKEVCDHYLDSLASGTPGRRGPHLIQMALCHLRLGQFELAQEYALLGLERKDVSYGGEIDGGEIDWALTLKANLLLSETYFRSRKFAQAVERIDHVLSRTDESSGADRELCWGLRTTRAFCRIALGELEPARAELRELKSEIGKIVTPLQISADLDLPERLFESGLACKLKIDFAIDYLNRLEMPRLAADFQTFLSSLSDPTARPPLPDDLTLQELYAMPISELRNHVIAFYSGNLFCP